MLDVTFSLTQGISCKFRGTSELIIFTLMKKFLLEPAVEQKKFQNLAVFLKNCF